MIKEFVNQLSNEKITLLMYEIDRLDYHEFSKSLFACLWETIDDRVLKTPLSNEEKSLAITNHMAAVKSFESRNQVYWESANMRIHHFFETGT